MKPRKVSFKVLPVLAFLFITTVSSRVLAWNDTGHMIAAYIAYQKLTPGTRDAVDQLLKEHPDFDSWDAEARKMSPKPLYTQDGKTRISEINRLIFMLAATWADRIRGDVRFFDKGDNGKETLVAGFPDMERHREWHFVETPFSTDSTPWTEPSTPNLLTEIPRLRGRLRDVKVDQNERAYALVWLIHLVGDAHQPLHCATRFSQASGSVLGDLGGNLFKIRNHGKTTSLHSYWDTLLGTSTSYSFVKTQAVAVMATYKPPTKAKESNESDWVDQSVELAKGFVYDVKPDEDIAGTGKGNTYAARAKEIAKRQLALAGYRLAGLLKENVP